MSLIKCPECNHSVSSKAPFCPNCGVPIENNIKRCPICGGYVLMAAERCPHCDTRFAPQEPAQTSNPVHTPEHAKTSEPAQAHEPATTPVSDDTTRSGADTAQAEQPQMVDPRMAPTRSGTPWYLLILAILLIGIGGFFYWENLNQEASEEKAFELLRDCNDPLNFEDFIARYPTSRHIDEVRSRLQELQREEALWVTVSTSDDAAKLQQFIDSHPTSPNKKVALHKIDSLDWREAERTGTSAAYNAYITRHDNGEYIDQAFEARAKAQEREEQARRDSIAAVEAARRDSIAAAEVPTDVIAPE